MHFVGASGIEPESSEPKSDVMAVIPCSIFTDDFFIVIIHLPVLGYYYCYFFLKRGDTVSYLFVINLSANIGADARKAKRFCGQCMKCGLYCMK